jgi:hypothetical protein
MRYWAGLQNKRDKVLILEGQKFCRKRRWWLTGKRRWWLTGKLLRKFSLLFSSALFNLLTK